MEISFDFANALKQSGISQPGVPQQSTGVNIGDWFDRAANVWLQYEAIKKGAGAALQQGQMLNQPETLYQQPGFMPAVQRTSNGNQFVPGIDNTTLLLIGGGLLAVILMS